MAYGNQLPFCVWRTLAPQQPPKTWTPEFTIADDDARLLSGRRPPALRLEFTDAEVEGGDET